MGDEGWGMRGGATDGLSHSRATDVHDPGDIQTYEPRVQVGHRQYESLH